MLKNLLSKKLWHRFKKIVLLLFFTTIFYGLFYFINQFLLIKTVTVEGDTVNSLNGMSIIYNKNILFLQEAQVSKILIDQNPEIRSVDITKNFPNKIILFIKLYEPYVVMPSNRGYLILSENGRIIEKSNKNTFSLPIINYYQKINHDSVNPGDKIDYKDVQVSLHFLGQIQDLGMRPNTIDINGLDMILFNLDDKKITFTTEKSIDIQDYELTQVIKQFKIEGRTFKNLDLRFDKPIIQF